MKEKLLTALSREFLCLSYFDIILRSFISLKGLTSQFFPLFFLSLASIIFYSKTNFFIHSRYVQTEAPPNMAPQSSQKSIMEMSVDRGSKIHLPCNIQGSPLPVYTWYRLSDSSSFYSVPSSQRIIPSQTLLLIRNVEERDAGRWVSFQPPL